MFFSFILSDCYVNNLLSVKSSKSRSNSLCHVSSQAHWTKGVWRHMSTYFNQSEIYPVNNRVTTNSSKEVRGLTSAETRCCPGFCTTQCRLQMWKTRPYLCWKRHTGRRFYMAMNDFVKTVENAGQPCSLHSCPQEVFTLAYMASRL